MLKRFVSILLIFMLVFSISVQASEVRAIRAAPRLTFSGTTATSSVDYKSGNSSDKISATLTLYQGNTYVNSWSQTGNGRVSISESSTVKKGKDYKLVLSYTVNGQSQNSVTVTGTCR